MQRDRGKANDFLGQLGTRQPWRREALLLIVIIMMAAIMPNGEAASLDSEVSLRFEGYEASLDKEPDRYRGDAAVSVKFKAGKKVRLVGKVRLQGDTAGFVDESRLADPLGRSGRRPLIDIDELYLRVKRGRFRFRAGFLRYAWGTADGYHPVDNLNPRDLTDLLRDEKASALSLTGRYHRGATTIDLVFLPVAGRARLPEPDQRFFPDLPPSAENPLYPASGPPSFDLRYHFPEPAPPPISADGIGGALRLKWKLPGSELAVSFQDLMSDLPAFRLAFDARDLDAGILDVTVTQEFYRKLVYGIDFQTAVGDYGLRGEASLVESRSDLVEDYTIAVFGADRRFADIVSEQDLTLIASFIASRGIASRGIASRGRQGGESTDIPGISGLNRPFDRALLLHLIWEFTDDAKLDLSALTAFSEGSYQDLEFSYRFSEHLTWSMKAERVEGPRDSFLGGLDKQDRLIAELHVRF